MGHLYHSYVSHNQRVIIWITSRPSLEIWAEGLYVCCVLGSLGAPKTRHFQPVVFPMMANIKGPGGPKSMPLWSLDVPNLLIVTNHDMSGFNGIYILYKSTIHHDESKIPVIWDGSILVPSFDHGTLWCSSPESSDEAIRVSSDCQVWWHPGRRVCWQVPGVCFEVRCGGHVALWHGTLNTNHPQLVVHPSQ